jgi:hypothetical protein
MTAAAQARQPEGIPTGGQYAAAAHSDAVPDLPRPVIEEMKFSHDGGSFEVERDGDGKYTIYATDEEGADVASFTCSGDPGDPAAIEAAAVEALTAQRARLRSVSTPGARVLWTDPDGGEVHPGKVVLAKGEIITVAMESGGEAEVFGNELEVDLGQFPHPDTKYPHPMSCWPEGVEVPASIVLGESDVTVDETPVHTLYPDPQNAITISEPCCTITMANGAALKVVYVGDPEDGNSEENFTGDWEPYVKGDTYTRDQVIETAHETMLQARK